MLLPGENIMKCEGRWFTDTTWLQSVKNGQRYDAAAQVKQRKTHIPVLFDFYNDASLFVFKPEWFV